jgi:hypothetical protein
VTDLQFVAALVNAVAWPVAVILAVAVLRPELLGILRRMLSIEFPGGRATFAVLPDMQMLVAAAAKDTGSSDDREVARREVTEFSVVQSLALTAPRQAIINAWGLLEYELNVASDRLDPGGPHGWPQVTHNLEKWDKWPLFYPTVRELYRLRDYTVSSNRPPSSEDAARYVAVAQELATTLRTAFTSQSDEDSDEGPGGST